MSLIVFYEFDLILFAALMPDMVSFRILKLMLETWKLISSRLMLASQFNWPMTLLQLDCSLSFNIPWGSKSCSLFSGKVFKLSAYVCVVQSSIWSVLIDISSFCLMLMPTYVKAPSFSFFTFASFQRAESFL